jgi:prefoldin subunit 5
MDGNEKIAILEKEIESLRAEIEELRRTVVEFMARFE